MFELSVMCRNIKPRCLVRSTIHILVLLIVVYLICFIRHVAKFATDALSSEKLSALTHSPIEDVSDKTFEIEENTPENLLIDKKFTFMKTTPEEYVPALNLNEYPTTEFTKKETIFQNITRSISGDLFSKVIDKYYEKPFSEFFNSNNSVGNFEEYEFLIKGKNICQGETPFLLIVIPSVTQNREIRDAIRNTWLGASETNTWPGTSIRVPVKHVFLFGFERYTRNLDFKTLVQESKQHNDIVMADFVDVYRNLTTKMLHGLKWAANYCKNVNYFLKMDEDTVLNTPLMVEFLLHAASNIRTHKFILGHLHTNPVVLRSDRWGVSEDEYPLDMYPGYMYGHTYVISGEAIEDLLAELAYVRIIAPEDVYITGLLAKRADVTRMSAPCFPKCCSKLPECDLVNNKNLAVTLNTGDPDTITSVWSRVKSGSCDPTLVIHPRFF